LEKIIDYPRQFRYSYKLNLDYSRVEVAADAIKIKNKNKKKVSIIIFNKILHVIEKKKIIKTSPFFYE